MFQHQRCRVSQLRRTCDIELNLDGALQVICIGMNYVDHCTEQDFPIPKGTSTLALPRTEAPCYRSLTSALLRWFPFCRAHHLQ